MFEIIKGDTGHISASGAKVAIMSHWNITRNGLHEDGTPRLRFRAQFSYVNDSLMNLKVGGLPIKKRVIIELKTKAGYEQQDIIGWLEWRYEGGILTLEDVLYGGLKRRDLVPTG